MPRSVRPHAQPSEARTAVSLCRRRGCSKDIASPVRLCVKAGGNRLELAARLSLRRMPFVRAPVEKYVGRAGCPPAASHNHAHRAMQGEWYCVGEMVVGDHVERKAHENNAQGITGDLSR